MNMLDKSKEFRKRSVQCAMLAWNAARMLWMVDDFSYFYAKFLGQPVDGTTSVINHSEYIGVTVWSPSILEKKNSGLSHKPPPSCQLSSTFLHCCFFSLCINLRLYILLSQLRCSCWQEGDLTNAKVKGDSRIIHHLHPSPSLEHIAR